MPSEPHRRKASKRRPSNPTADHVVADQIRTLRERLGVTQQELADKLGWPQSTIARLELGKRSISVSDLLALCWALHVAPIYVLSGSFTGDNVPVKARLKLTPSETREWITGDRPLPGADERVYSDVAIPDDVAAENRAVVAAFKALRDKFPAGASLVVSSDEAAEYPAQPRIEIQWDENA